MLVSIRIHVVDARVSLWETYLFELKMQLENSLLISQVSIQKQTRMFG